MRVALDARSLQAHPPNGVGRVTGQVVPHLEDRVQFELLTQSELPPLEMGLPEHAFRTPWPGLASEWLQGPAARWLKGFDGIFHCPWYALPFVQHVPMAVTLHDLSFERHPEWFGRARRRSYVVQARWAARTARAVLTTSHAVADDITATYGVPAERIFVAIPAVDSAFRPDLDATAVLTRLGVRRPYVVALGGSSRRNLPTALEAWRAVSAQRPLDLVVAGPDRLPPEPGLVVGRFDDDDWSALMANAAALLYPTWYEGFGLPAVEAAICGTPVICARVGSLPEVLGDAAAWCEAPSAPAIAARLKALLDSPGEAADIAAAGRRRASELPTAAQAAEAYYAAYELTAKSG